MNTGGMDFVRFAFEISDLIPKKVGDRDAEILFGLSRPNPRSPGNEIMTSLCKPLLIDLGRDVVLKQLQFSEQESECEESSSNLLAARFASVGMHTDEGFPRHCVVIPICGAGHLDIYCSNSEIRQVSIRRGIGVVFDNHRPHDFVLTSTQPMIAVLVSLKKLTKQKWNTLKKNEIKASRL